MKNVEKVAELFRKLLVDGWERAVISGEVYDGGATYDFQFRTKVNGEYINHPRRDCDTAAICYEAAHEMANDFQYKFTMVLLPNGEVTVDEGKCCFDYDEDDDEWEKKYLT